MVDPARILIIDDEPELCRYLDEGLTARGFQVQTFTAAAAALRFLDGADVDVVVTDLQMRSMGGLELCERVSQNRPDLPVVVITAFGSLELAIAAIRVGAYDFLTKPFELDVLVLALTRAARHKALRAEVKRLRETIEHSRGFDDMVGQSPVMQSLYDLLGRVAENDATVLLTGESGTGKEIAARAIHRRGARAAGPFVAINCAAVPEALLESELFGHARGAFTDAKATRPGLFQRAAGGTIFLDEIGELPLVLQPKLLRALQERVVRPVGADDEVPFNARIVAATNRDLEAAVEEGRFREDLYYRVNVIHVALPPLRARGADVLLLAQHFIARHAGRMGKQVRGLSQAAAEKLLGYAFPGNVRELDNAIERAVALTRFDEIVVDDLPERIRDYRRSHVVVAAEDPTEFVPLEEVERRYILRAVDAFGGNRAQAARALGLDRKTLYRKLLQYQGEKGSKDPRA